MKIKDVSRITGVKENALRFYEKKGLLCPKRGDNGYREYQESDLQKMLMIQLYRSLGFSIEQIKQLFCSSEQQNQVELYFEQQAFLNQKIKELSLIREGIGTCLDESLMGLDTQEKTMEILRQTQSHITNAKSWKDEWDFDAWAHQYDDVVANAHTALPFYKHYEEALQRCASIVNKAGGDILEIGVGTGNLMNKLQGERIVGIDQSIQMVLLAKKKHPNFSLRLGTFLNIPFPTHSFSCIVTSYAFHHNRQEEKKRAMQEMDRVIKEDGHIVICDLMFENKEKRKQYEATCSKAALLELQDEYFANVDELVALWASLHYTCHVEQIDEVIWIVHAKKG